MRARPAARLRLPLLVLVLGFVLYSALGAIVTCHDAGQPARTDAVDRVATTAPLPGVVSCPDCAPAPQTDPSRQPWPPGGTGPGPMTDPCTSDRPCQHGPTSGHTLTDAAVRGSGPGPAATPVALPVCALPYRVDPPPVAPSATGPVPPPAVQAPVPVLCVDRN